MGGSAMLLLLLVVVALFALGGASRTTRIVNGQPVVAGQTPDVTWQVGLFIGNSLCGGSIIAPDLVLTAAHCMFDLSAGTNQNPRGVCATPGIRNSPGSASRTGVESWVHPSYRSTTASNARVDLAIVRVNAAFTLSSSVTVVPLAPSTCTQCGVSTPTPTQYVVSGYGTTVSTASGSSQSTSSLRWAAQQFVDFATCDAAAPFQLPLVSLCAGPIGGQSGTDSCQGDSGGPLVTLLAGTYTQVGVVSSGTVVSGEGLPLCGSPNEFGIYVSVMATRTWIDSVVSGAAGAGFTSGSGSSGGCSSNSNSIGGIDWYFLVVICVAGATLLLVLVMCIVRARRRNMERQQLAHRSPHAASKPAVRPPPVAMYPPQQPAAAHYPPPAAAAPSYAAPTYQPQTFQPQPQVYYPNAYPGASAPPPPVAYEMPTAPPPPANEQPYGGTYGNM